jgi:hypothetical protein
VVTGEEAPRRRRAGVIVGVALVMAFALLGATALILKAFADAPAVAPSKRPGMACGQLEVPGQGRDDGYCMRIADDYFSRPELTGEQRAALSGHLTAVQRAVGQLSYCHYRDLPPTQRPQCGGVPTGRTMTEAHVDAVHRVLVEAGYPLAIVRLARADDPASRGSVLYAVPADKGCIVGQMTGYGQDLARPLAPLPGGQCLKP